MKNLTAEHFTVGAKVETKSGKKGVITHVHKKSGYLFIHDPGEGKTYHVSWGSVTQINGKPAAEVAGKPAASDDPNRKADQPKEKPSSASQGATENYWQSPAGKAILEAANKPKGPGYPAVTALQSHGWKAVKTDSMGALTFAHPKLGGEFHVDVDGTLINANSGTEIKPEKAAEYLRGFHANSEKQAELAAKQKAAEGVAKGISTDYKDYKPGDDVVSHDGKEWEVHSAIGKGVYGIDKEHPGAHPTFLKWNEIAKHTPYKTWSDEAKGAKKEGPGSRGSTKWYYDAHGNVRYGEPPNGVLPEPGEPPEGPPLPPRLQNPNPRRLLSPAKRLHPRPLSPRPSRQKSEKNLPPLRWGTSPPSTSK